MIQVKAIQQGKLNCRVGIARTAMPGLLQNKSHQAVDSVNHSHPVTVPLVPPQLQQYFTLIDHNQIPAIDPTSLKVCWPKD